MWNNEEWAAKHIKKHKIVPQDAWEIYESCVHPLRALDQLRFPPFRRLWTIGQTKMGIRLLIIWEEHREIKNLVTAFEPDEEKVRIYERKIKKGAK